MTRPIVINPTLDVGGVTVTGETIAFDFDAAKIVDGIADAVAASIVSDINSSGKWIKTGHLIGGIRAVDGVIAAPSDRLDRPGLPEKFREDIATMRDPLTPAPVKKALDKAIDDTVVVKAAR